MKYMALKIKLRTLMAKADTFLSRIMGYVSFVMPKWFIIDE